MRLECRDLTKQYFKVTAVDHVNLTLEPGKIYALLGPNGSGKSTLMKMIVGLIKPSGGEILFEGAPLTWRSRDSVAYMPTEPYYFLYMTCLDMGKYYRDFFDDFDMDAFMGMLADMELAPELKCRELSSGMAAKLKIALTMARKSRLIMLDEPLNGIDLVARDKIISAIIHHLTEDTTVLLSSHLVDEMEKIVDDALFMKNGQLVLTGSAEGLRETRGMSLPDIYREIYGTPDYMGSAGYPAAQAAPGAGPRAGY